MAATITQPRPVDGFDAISLDGVGTVEFVQQPEYGLTVECEPDAVDLITTTVTDGTLHINTKLISVKFISLKHPPVYKISAPDLRSIELRGAGRAIIGELKTDHLLVSVDGAGDIRLTNQSLGDCRVQISGAGNVKAAGTATVQDIEIRGTGNYSGEQLVGETGRVNIAGAGRAKVNISRELRVDIGGVGSVSYLGDPALQSNIHGLGRVKRA